MTRPESPGRPDPSVPPHPRPHPGWGTGTRLWLLRHAEVHADWQGKAYGGLDVPLSATGEERTRAMVADFGALALDAAACSPLSRAALLGHGIARAAGIEAAEDDGLREIDRGSWQGRAVEEINAAHPGDIDAFYADPWGWKGHGGECDDDLDARAWGAVEVVVRRATGGVALVASHYNVIRIVLAAALGVPPERSFALRIDTGRAALLIDAPGGWHLGCTNIVAPATDGEGAA